MEQLLPTADHAQHGGEVSAHRRARVVAVDCCRWIAFPSLVLHRDHRLTALHHPAGGGFPLPPALLAIWPGNGRRQGLTASKGHHAHGCTATARAFRRGVLPRVPAEPSSRYGLGL